MSIIYCWVFLKSSLSETMYLLGNLLFFKIHVNHFMAWDDSPSANVISKCMLWVRGLVPLWVLRHFLSLISSCTQSPCPCSNPLLTRTSTGDTQTQFCLSFCGVSGSWCTQGLFEPSEHLWRVWGLMLNTILPLLLSCFFILFMGFSRQEYWSGLPFPSPVDHILSDLSTMTCPPWWPHTKA